MNTYINGIYTFIIILFVIFTNGEKVYSLEKSDILFISSYNPNFISFND